MSLAEFQQRIAGSIGIIKVQLGEMLEFIRSSSGDNRSTVGDGWVRMNDAMHRLTECMRDEDEIMLLAYEFYACATVLDDWLGRIERKLEHYKETPIVDIHAAIVAAANDIWGVLAAVGVDLPARTGGDRGG
jgi:hypothetical protein